MSETYRSERWRGDDEHHRLFSGDVCVGHLTGPAAAVVAATITTAVNSHATHAADLERAVRDRASLLAALKVASIWTEPVDYDSEDRKIAHAMVVSAITQAETP